MKCYNIYFFPYSMVKFKKITEGAKNIMNDQSIINLIEITLEEKMNENDEFIKYTFYD